MAVLVQLRGGGVTEVYFGYNIERLAVAQLPHYCAELGRVGVVLRRWLFSWGRRRGRCAGDG